MDTSQDVPLKDFWKGEEYSEEEVKFLKGRWSGEDINEVAKWLDAGADPDKRPDCVTVLGKVEVYGEEFHIYDLRGIDLVGRLTRVRTEEMPTIDLRLARLEHADLRWAHLEHVDLRQGHLEHADLGGTHLEHADLSFARLEHARLREAHLEHAHLLEAHLEHADLQSAHLEHADLRAARLEHANLWQAHLELADLIGAHLEHAYFTEADLRGAKMSYVYLDDTVFGGVKWRPSPRGLPDPDLYKGFDVRGLRYSPALFDQFVRQSEFIRGCRETLPKWVFEAWELSCDCGRSFWRLAKICGIVIYAFALIFLAAPIVEPTTDVAALKEALSLSPLTYVYFSVVTFSTLGFGDVTPCHWVGQVVVILEVLLGYVALGALISVFSMKILPPR